MRTAEHIVNEILTIESRYQQTADQIASAQRALNRLCANPQDLNQAYLIKEHAPGYICTIERQLMDLRQYEQQISFLKSLLNEEGELKDE